MSKKYYKMYKSGKNWMIAAVVAATLGVGAVTTNAMADTNTGATTTQAVATSQHPTATTQVAMAANQQPTATTQMATASQQQQENYLAHIEVYDENNFGAPITNHNVTYQPQAQNGNGQMNIKNQINGQTSTQAGGSYTVTAPAGYTLDTNYTKNYIQTYASSLQNATSNSIQVNLKNELNDKSRNSTYTIWAVKNGEQPASKSKLNVPDNVNRVVLDFFNESNGNYIASYTLDDYSKGDAKSTLSNGQDTVYKISAPKGYQFAVKKPNGNSEYGTSNATIKIASLNETHTGTFDFKPMTWRYTTTNPQFKANAKGLVIYRLWLNEDPSWQGVANPVQGVSGATTDAYNAAQKKAAEEAQQKAAQEAAQKKAAEEAQQKAAQEAAQKKAAEEAQQKAAQEAAQKKAAEEAQQKAAQEAAQKKAAEEAQQKAAQGAAQKKAAEEAQQKQNQQTSQKQTTTNETAAQKTKEGSTTQTSANAQQKAAATVQKNSSNPAEPVTTAKIAGSTTAANTVSFKAAPVTAAATTANASAARQNTASTAANTSSASQTTQTASANKLPQTGSANGSALVALGFASLLGMFGLGLRKKF